MRTDIETVLRNFPGYVQGLEARLEELRTAADQADAEYREEIARLRLTDAEREAVEQAAEHARQDALHGAAATLRALLERMGGGR